MLSIPSLLILLASSALAYPPLLRSRQSAPYTAPGVATFNDYAAQSGTVCGPIAGSGGTYGAAASDISPNIAGGKCDATIDTSKCSGQQPIAGYQGPSCPKTNCGTCYTVTNQGAVGGGSIGGVGNSITVQIIDSCPAESAQNYCKTDVPANERCGDPSTNQLDIDQSAYQALTGQPFGSGPNLEIQIAPACCPGASGCTAAGGAGSSKAAVSSGGGATPTTAAPPPAATTANPSSGGGQSSSGSGSGTAQLYDQCGGLDNSTNKPWSGPTTCPSGSKCQVQNQYYSQCVPG